MNVDQPKVDPQGSLFDDADLRPLPQDIGYRGPVACAAAGITYRQLDYWARTELVVPTVRGAHGSGTQRLYSFRDILVLRIVKRLIDTGVSLPNIRAAVDHLALRSSEDLARMTLMSDGATIYECRSADEVVDLVRGGQGVFGIAVGSVWREVEGTLASLMPSSLAIASTCLLSMPSFLASLVSSSSWSSGTRVKQSCRGADTMRETAEDGNTADADEDEAAEEAKAARSATSP